jgi:photosystem II stability/assembly factor-like uncharacterized protein
LLPEESFHLNRLITATRSQVVTAESQATWQVIPSPIENAGESIVSDDAIIVAEDNFIWRSTDDGATWDVVEQFALTGISSFAKAGTKLFGAATTGIQTSTDNGASWSFEAFSSGAYSFSASGNTILSGFQQQGFQIH